MKLALLMPGGVDRSGEDRVVPAFLWLIERLAMRHDVHVFALRQEGQPASWMLRGATVHNIGDARGWRRRLLATFATEHRRSRFAVIHGFFGWGGTYGALLGWRHRLRVLFHASGGEFAALDNVGYGMRLTARGRCELAVATAGATRVTVSSRFMQRMAGTLGIRAEVVTLGVALDEWPSTPPRARDVARPLRLIHVADIRPVKGQATLFAAARLLQENGLDFVLDVCGLDTSGGDVARSDDALALGSRLRWHGVLGRAALRDVVDRADLLVMSSHHEAGPLVVLEAALAGVPTVGTSVGHVADWSPDGALAVPVGNAPQLARAIGALVNDEPRRMSMATEAQRRALLCDADATAAAFERMYEEVLA